MARKVTAEEVACFLGCPVQGNAATLVLERPSTLQTLAPGTVAFAKALTPEARARAESIGALLLLIPDSEQEAPRVPHIRCRSPRQAFARVVRQFYAPKPSRTIARTAVVAPDAIIGTGVTIGEYSVIGVGAVIGDETEIRHHVTIGPRVVIGRRCLIKSGSVIGEEGFGIDKDEAGNNLRLPHIGSVVIGDEVEVGALNTICSGTVEPTRVADFVKMDDHVHVAHNVSVGKNCILTACTEISGSVDIGEDVWLGPNCSIMNGIQIGDKSFIGLGTVVIKSLPAGVTVAGSPARETRKTT